MAEDEIAKEPSIAALAVALPTPNVLSAVEDQGSSHERSCGGKLTAGDTCEHQEEVYEDDFECSSPQYIQQKELHDQLHQDRHQPTAEHRSFTSATKAHPDSTTSVINTESSAKHHTSSREWQQARHQHILLASSSACVPPSTSRHSSSRPSTAELLTRGRPLSAQLRSLTAGPWQLGVTCSSIYPPKTESATAMVASQGSVGHRKSSGESAAPRKPWRPSPGPGSYSPQTDHKGKLMVIGNSRGSFSTAARYEGSYIQAFANTLHSPGPIYYPDNAGVVTSRSGGRIRANTATNSTSNVRLSITTCATHSMMGSWGRADVGSREQLLVHRCRSASPLGRQGMVHQHYNDVAVGGSSTSGWACTSSSGCHKECPGCSAAGWSTPGPGSYDSNVGKDGKGLLLTQSCPAYTLPKARKLVSGRRCPVVSKQHAAHENQGADSPGPVYYPDVTPVRPSSCSPTMMSRGVDHWDLVHNSTRAPKAKQLLGPDAISRNSNHLLGDGPHTHFGTASLEDQQWPHISDYHSYVLYRGRHTPINKYKPSYSQVDPHVCTRSLSSGHENRFEDVSHLSYITHAAGVNKVQ